MRGFIARRSRIAPADAVNDPFSIKGLPDAKGRGHSASQDLRPVVQWPGVRGAQDHQVRLEYLCANFGDDVLARLYSVAVRKPSGEDALPGGLGAVASELRVVQRFLVKPVVVVCDLALYGAEPVGERVSAFRLRHTPYYQAGGTWSQALAQTSLAQRTG